EGFGGIRVDALALVEHQPDEVLRGGVSILGERPPLAVGPGIVAALVGAPALEPGRAAAGREREESEEKGREEGSALGGSHERRYRCDVRTELSGIPFVKAIGRLRGAAAPSSRTPPRGAAGSRTGTIPRSSARAAAARARRSGLRAAPAAAASPRRSTASAAG